MNPTTVAITLIAAHFLGDWILQFRWMAENKSKSWTALAAHICTVGAVLCGAMCFLAICGVDASPISLIIYLVAHGIQDRYIWRFYEKYYHDTENPDRKGKAFYNTIAIDQFIHLSLLTSLFL